MPTTVKQIAYNYPTIKFMTGSEIVVKKLYECGVDKKNIFYLKPSVWYNLGMFQCKLEPLTHDTPNYALKVKYREQKVIYIVDTANVDNIIAKGYDLYLIENNYQEDILKKHLEEAIENNDENKIYYLKRTMNTHLSKQKCDSFLIENMGNNSVYEYVHISNYNNTETGEIK